jgi:hypothetical protein
MTRLLSFQIARKSDAVMGDGYSVRCTSPASQAARGYVQIMPYGDGWWATLVADEAHRAAFTESPFAELAEAVAAALAYWVGLSRLPEQIHNYYDPARVAELVRRSPESVARELADLWARFEELAAIPAGSITADELAEWTAIIERRDQIRTWGQ